MSDDETISLGKTITSDSTSLPRAEKSGEMPETLGPVQLVREIGRGGMGIVYLGRHKILDRDVAVKKLLTKHAGSDADYDRFLKEVRAAARVQHAGLLPIHHAEVKDNTPYMIMEYVDGASLSELIRRNARLEAAHALAVLESICPAVTALHDEQLVHRDIKPSNILVNHNGQVYLSDFGLAEAKTLGDNNSSTWAGTPAYMAPEMFTGEVSPRTDVFALGATTFEMLSGKHCCSGSLSEIRKQHDSGEISATPLIEAGMDQDIIGVIERALHVDSRFRYKSASQFLRAFKEACPKEILSTDGKRILASLVSDINSPINSDEKGLSNTATKGDSYFNQISALASKKRPDTNDRETKRTKNKRNEPQNIESKRVYIAVDLCCVDCQYNLRGLDPKGRCPECGVHVEKSTARSRLVFAKPETLKTISSGLNLLSASFFIVVFSVIALSLKPMIFPALELEQQNRSVETIVVWGARLFIWLFALFGLWKATSPLHDEYSKESLKTAVYLCRGMFLTGTLVYLVAEFTKTTGAAGFTEWLKGIILALAFGTIVTLIHILSALLKRAEAERLAKQMWLLMAIPIICIATNITLKLLGIPTDAGIVGTKGVVFLTMATTGILALLFPFFLIYTFGKCKQVFSSTITRHVSPAALIKEKTDLKRASSI